MKKRLISTVLTLCLCVSVMPSAYALKDRPVDGAPAAAEAVWSDAAPGLTEESLGTAAGIPAPAFAEAEAREAAYPTYEEAYDKMIDLKSTYPEGLTWTNFQPYGNEGSLGKYYTFKGGAIKGARHGVGCAAFCFLLSDEVFGDRPANVRDAGNFTFDDIRVSDFLRVDDSHFVTVLKITSSGVIIAEGNYNKTVHWGRAISKEQLMASANFLVSRYPANYSENVTAETVAEGTEPGTDGTLDWKISSNGVLSITGSNTIRDYGLNSGERPSWEAATKADGSEAPFYSVDIGSGVTGVGAYAFYQNKDLVSVSLPSTIASIGDSAFNGSGIVGIAIPGNVTSVGNDAFRLCKNLASVDIAEGVKTIGERAFHSCTALGYVDFPSSLTSLGAGAFTSCEKLTQVRFMPSSGSLAIGGGAFTQCWNLHLVSLPKGITELPPGAFSSCKTIFYLYIPSTVTTLGQVAVDSPFIGSYVNTVYFGGTQAAWDTMMNSLKSIPALEATTYAVLSAATVEFEQSDPFVPEANDPGDFHPCENGKHAGPFEDGICQNCGEPAEPPEPEGHTHSWAAEWSSNEGHHWHECTASGCPITNNSGKDGYDAHVYDNSGDATCNICGYIRSVNSGSGSSSDSGSGGGSSDSTSASTNTSTTRNPDGSITTKMENKTTGTVTETTKNPDGSQTKVETKKDGTVTITETDKAGNKTETVKKPDGSSVTKVAQKDGTAATVTTDIEGKVEAEVKLPEKAVAAAQEKKEAIALPIPGIQATRSAEAAPMVTVKTGSKDEVKVEIPVSNVTPGTVAVIVKANGTEEVVKTSVPTESGLAVSLPDGATVKLVDKDRTFDDVPAGNWAADAVRFGTARELFAGTSETAFSPNAPMTRAMLMTVLARLDGADTTGGDTWYEKGVDWAVASGVSDGSNPNGNITREQLAVMLWRYSGSPAPGGTLDKFPDAGSVSGYAQDALRWAVENGIISGYGNGQLAPNNQATRAEVASIIMRYTSGT